MDRYLKKGYAAKEPSKKYPDIVSQTKEIRQANQQPTKIIPNANLAYANPMMTPMAGGHISEEQMPKVPTRAVKEP